MKITMRTKISGTRDGVDWPDAGESLTVSDAEGADLCAQGYASPATPAPEKATVPAPETAAAPKPRTRKA